jgi:tRNA(adenine34) deaminase
MIPVKHLRAGTRQANALKVMQQWPLPPPMQRALALAREAAGRGSVPVGAVVTHKGKVIGEGTNAPKDTPDPTAHAEIAALRMAAEALGTGRLSACELWVTLEPCAMCAGAIAHARIAKLYYAASDPKGGAVEHGSRVFDHPQALHKPEVYSGMGEAEAAAILRRFFEQLR